MKTPKLRIIGFAAVAIGALVSLHAASAQETRTARVTFARGASSTSIHDRIKGDQTVNYELGAGAGQTMVVSLASANTAAYFNVYEPGKVPGRDEAMFISASSGNRFEGPLPTAGTYTIQVYLYRSAARRGEVAKYTLDVAISGGAAAQPAASGGDAKVAGTDFHATGEIPCATSASQPMHSCRFGVVRQGNGNATVTVFLPGGGERSIRFTGGKATSSDGAGAVTTKKAGDLNKISIGSGERFEIPDVVIVGD